MFDATMQNPHKGSLNKRQKFRYEIRDKQVSSMIKNLRRKYLVFKDPNNFQVLKNIDLIACLKYFMNTDIYPQKSIDDMFLYASSRQSDHLYELFDQSILCKLIELATKKQNNNKIEYQKKIMWILTNYTAYSNGEYLNRQIQNRYIMLLQELAIEHQIQKHGTKFDHSLLEFITLSIANILYNQCQCKYFVQNYHKLLRILLSSFECTSPLLFEILRKQKQSPLLLRYFLELLDNLFTTMDIKDIAIPQLQLNILDTLISLQEYIFDNIQHFKGNSQQVSIIILRILQSAIFNSQSSIQLLLQTNNMIFKLSKAYQRFIQLNIDKVECVRIIMAYNRWLEAIYHIDPEIDSANQERCMSFMVQLFKEHVTFNNQALISTVLKLLEDIFLQQQLCQIILTDNICLMSQIFRVMDNAQSNFSHRKLALLCLINLLKCTVYSESETAKFTLQIICCNKFEQKMMEYLWKYADTSLNLNLIEGFQVILEYQKLQGTTYLTKYFLMNDLKLRVQTVYLQTSYTELKEEANKLLQIIQDLQCFDQSI